MVFRYSLCSEFPGEDIVDQKECKFLSLALDMAGKQRGENEFSFLLTKENSGGVKPIFFLLMSVISYSFKKYLNWSNKLY